MKIPPDWKEKLKVYVKTMEGITIVFWIIGAIITILVGACIGPINQTCELAAMVVAVFICKLSVLAANFIYSSSIS